MDSVSISSLSLLPATAPATPLATQEAAAVSVGGGPSGVTVGTVHLEKESAIADGTVPLVDPFLVEALQNPRHRVTILRMELDVQRLLQNSDLQQFEFQPLPTSYLRLAGHRVAQHYGLQTMVLDNAVDGQAIRILVRKLPESKYPTICLSDVPVKQTENVKFEQVKIVLKQRPNKDNGAGDSGSKRSPVRTVEERKEEYDRARARIFNSQSSSESEDTWNRVHSAEKGSHLDVEDNRNVSSVVDVEKNMVKEIGSSSRVAIFRDREKDRTDPDYDRSYVRYVRNAPPTHQNFTLPPYVPNLFQPYVHYDPVHPQFGLMPGTQVPPLHYRTQALPVGPFCAGGLSQPARDPVYFQWPSQSMMYVHSYDQFRHSVFQAPCYQQPLSFDYSLP